MSIEIDGEEIFTKNEMLNRLEKFVQNSSLESELRKNRKNNIISVNSKINYV
ncbi:MAG: hypothetical protein Q9M94_06595 [Candidatus Gracilibacteria bacterium]|nr:hypothetical protein [Candidatus Gracilibacteria bacterium]MDQ7022978.1 hypothetical protein [Candidatus Gracilibacteria bacterium]